MRFGTLRNDERGAIYNKLYRGGCVIYLPGCFLGRGAKDNKENYVN